MKETFKVSVINTKTQSRAEIESTAVTLADLKDDLSNNGIDYAGMTFMEGSTKIELKDDSSILPTNVPVKRNGVTTGETTNNLVFFLTTPNKNIKSGSMTRPEAYAEIKKNNLQDTCKTRYGRNFTQCSTAQLLEVIASIVKNTPTVDIPDNTQECGVCKCTKELSAKILDYAKALLDAGYFDQAVYDGFAAITRGEEAPKVSHNGYSDSDIDSMYGSWMN